MFRTRDGLLEMTQCLAELQDRYSRVRVAGPRPGLQHRPARGARAGLPARLRRGDGLRRRWPARSSRGGHFREDFPERDDTALAAPHAGLQVRLRTAAARVQARHDHQVRAQAADVLSGVPSGAVMLIRPARPALQPGARQEAALGGLPRRVGADGPRARPAAQGQGRDRRHADVPPLVRPRRVRLGRDDDQRPQPAGVQDPRRPAGQQDLGRAAARLPRDQGPRRRHGAVLRPVPQRHAVPDGRRRRRRRSRSGSSRPRTGRATTTRPSASCAPPAPAHARRSGRSRRTSARPPSSTPTASSSTRATTTPTSGSRSWPTRTACGAAARSSTAPMPARAASTSPAPSSRCPARSWSGRPEAAHPGRRRGPRQSRPGFGGRGADRRFAARTPHDPDAPPIAAIARPLGIQTNNFAEYTAVVLALRRAHELGADEVELVLDSKLIVEQLSGRWKIKHPAIAPLAIQAQAELRRLRRWSIRHEPRANNRQADALANLALDDPRAAAAAEAGALGRARPATGRPGDGPPIARRGRPGRRQTSPPTSTNCSNASYFRTNEPENGLVVDGGRPVTLVGAAVNTTFAAIDAAAAAGVGAAARPSHQLAVHRPLAAREEAGAPARAGSFAVLRPRLAGRRRPHRHRLCPGQPAGYGR